MSINGCTRAESANYFSNGSSPFSFLWLLFLSLDTCSQNETWWFVILTTKISKNRHFCLVTLRCSPDHMGARTPKKCTPTILKSWVARPFLWNMGSGVLVGLKMTLLELRVQTIFQMVIPSIYESWLAFLSLNTCSQNATWWFVISLTKISKIRHFCLVTSRVSPGSHGCPNP